MKVVYKVYKIISDSLGFQNPRCGSRIPGTRSLISKGLNSKWTILFKWVRPGSIHCQNLGVLDETRALVSKGCLQFSQTN